MALQVQFAWCRACFCMFCSFLTLTQTPRPGKPYGVDAGRVDSRQHAVALHPLQLGLHHLLVDDVVLRAVRAHDRPVLAHVPRHQRSSPQDGRLSRTQAQVDRGGDRVSIDSDAFAKLVGVSNRQTDTQTTLHDACDMA